MIRAQRGAILCGAGSLIVSIPAALACPDGLGISTGGILAAAGASCNPGCVTQDCASALPPPATTDGSGARGGPPFVVEMVKFTFLPNSPIIKPNTTVRWDNTSFFSAHTTTRLPTWDSGIVNPGDFFDFTFTGANAGLSYHYECTLHFGMEGDINVALFGDANLDTIVNLQDFNVLAGHFGQTGQQWETGDFNEDGIVNLQDFNLLAANFGREIQPAGFTLDLGALVPEPSMTMIFLPAMLLAGRRARGTRHVLEEL
jgi:plastocyanin